MVKYVESQECKLESKDSQIRKIVTSSRYLSNYLEIIYSNV